MKVHAEVRQLQQARTFVNVMNNLEGGIGLWGHAYKCPTYLLITGDNWIIVTYDTEEDRDESLGKLAKHWGMPKVFELPKLEELRL